MASSSIEIFFSYSHEDEELREKLDKQLSLLWRSGVARSWHDWKIAAGEDFRQAIDQHLNSAQVIVLLVSADFLASEYCYGIEMKRALERHAAGEAQVIPVILRHVDWKDAPFSALNCLPSHGKPVRAWRDVDEALANVARGIREVVEKLLGDTVLDDDEALAPRPSRRRWLWAAVAAVAAVVLIAAGLRQRAVQRETLAATVTATSAAAGLGPQEEARRMKLAFATGWFIALAGQSSTSSPAALFDRALVDLGVAGDDVRALDRRYHLIEAAARDGTLRYGDFETAKSQLLGQTGEQLQSLHGPPSAATAVLGHDTAALLLLLRHWNEAEKEGDVLATARDRVMSLQKSVNNVAVPAALAGQLRALRASELGSDAYRRDAERVLDETVRYFDLPAP